MSYGVKVRTRGLRINRENQKGPNRTHQHSAVQVVLDGKVPERHEQVFRNVLGSRPVCVGRQEQIRVVAGHVVVRLQGRQLGGVVWSVIRDVQAGGEVHIGRDGHQKGRLGDVDAEALKKGLRIGVVGVRGNTVFDEDY